MKNESKKEIQLTKDQYLALAKIVYLGNWMANAQRTGAPGDPRLEEYENLSDYIFSLAPEFGFSENLEDELKFFGKGEEPTEVHRLNEEYDAEILTHAQGFPKNQILAPKKI